MDRRELLIGFCGAFLTGCASAPSQVDIPPMGNLQRNFRQWVEYCNREGLAFNDGACDMLDGTTPAAPIEYTHELEVILANVNRSVNNTYAFRDDMGPDHWTSEPHTYADCDDYVLAKRRILMEEYGLPWQALQPTICKERLSRTDHLVLLVNTDNGYFVMDNVRNEIIRWDRLSGYIWLYRLDGQRGWVDFD